MIRIEYQKTINLLDNETTRQSKFKTKNWVEINDLRGKYDTGNQIEFKTAMLKSRLYNYSHA